MIGPDPRSGDDTEDLPSALEGFTDDVELRASTGHIVARAAGLLSLFGGDGGTWPKAERSRELNIGIVRRPAWREGDLIGAVSLLEPFALGPRRSKRAQMGAWAESLPDDIPPGVESTSYRRIAEVQASAAARLARTDEAPNDAVLQLVAASLLDGHPLVRVAAAIAVAVHDEERLLRRPDPIARAVLYDALKTRSDEVVTLAAAGLRRPFVSSRRLLGVVQVPEPSEPTTVRPDAALIHGTWARRQKWWRPSGDFHRFLREEAIFPGLYAGPEPWRWSGYYGLRNRLPRHPIDWARTQAGGALAWWTEQNLDCPPHLIGHSCGASVAMLATTLKRDVRALVMLSPSVHRTCIPDDRYYRGALLVTAHTDLVLGADGSDHGLLDPLPRFEKRRVRRKGLTGHSASHDPCSWADVELDAWVRDEWLPRL